MAGSCTRDDNVHRSRSTFRLYRSPSLQRTLCHHQGKLSLSESARPPTLSVVLIRDTSFVRCGAALEVESLDLVDAKQNKWGSIFTPRLEIAIVYYLKLRTRPSRSQAASRHISYLSHGLTKACRESVEKRRFFETISTV